MSLSVVLLPTRECFARVEMTQFPVKGCKNVGLSSAPTCMSHEQGEIFIVPHLLWHGTSVFAVCNNYNSSLQNHTVLLTIFGKNLHLLKTIVRLQHSYSKKTLVDHILDEKFEDTDAKKQKADTKRRTMEKEFKKKTASIRERCQRLNRNHPTKKKGKEETRCDEKCKKFDVA